MKKIILITCVFGLNLNANNSFYDGLKNSYTRKKHFVDYLVKVNYANVKMVKLYLVSIRIVLVN